MRKYLFSFFVLLIFFPLLAHGRGKETTVDRLPEGFGVTVSVGRPEYVTRLEPFEPPKIEMELRVFNESNQAASIEFASGQQFDFLIQDSSGRVVWRWSEGKFFIQILGQLTLAPGESRTFTASHRFADELNGPMDEGLYTVTGKLASPSSRIEGKTTFSHVHLF
jgi:hypothetical protein